jgi:hypothetical protein
MTLAVAICLAASATFSSFLLFLNRAKDGEIALHDGAHNQETETNSRSDPFDVVKPDDLSQGQPIDELSFWSRVRVSSLYIFSCVLIFGGRCDCENCFFLGFLQ